MNTNNKLHLYIGLGDIGIQTLAYTKDLFMDLYGEIPSSVNFLGISTKYTPHSRMGVPYYNSIDSDELMLLQTTINPERFIKESLKDNLNKEKISWIPINIKACTGFSMYDAYNWYRFGGRYEFIMHRGEISSRITQKVQDILHKNNARSSSIEIHVIFSTICNIGAGMAIDMGYLLEELGLHRTTLHAARVYDSTAPTYDASFNNIMTNATLFDLDYMHSLRLDKHMVFHYLDRDYTATTPPYLQVFLSDHHANNIYDVAKKQSLILLSRYQKSISWESIEDAQNGGEFGVGNKKAWCNCSNACEIIYTGGDIYKLKAAINIIDRMFNTCADADIIANAWIDSANVRQYQITDYIAPKEPRYALILEKANYKDPSSAVNPNIEANKLNGDEVTEKIDALLTKIRGELLELLVQHINAECGVSSAQDIIEQLKLQIGLCLAEMKQEKEDLTKKRASLKTYLEAAVADLKEYANRIFPIPTRSGKEQLADDVAVAVRQYNICLIDIQCHDAAITFYNSVLVILGENETRMANIESLLRTVKQDIQLDIAKLQNGLTSEGSIFQINLAEEDAKSISVKSDDILITEFISTLSGDLKVYGLTEYSAREIKNMILNYTSTLKGANRSITDVIHNMSYTDIRALTKKCIDSFEKSQYIDWESQYINWESQYINWEGHTPHYEPLDIFIICADDPHIFEEHFIYKIEQHINLRNKIIICKYTYSVPIYAIKNTIGKDNHILRDLDNGVHHFDNNVFEKMKSEKWNIFPKQSNNDELN